ncbi:MAG: energy-coupling factor transporter ATPase, partial [Clostridia bacterium]|nr:energy-coupling factor transporter ATPase [Clostridia bacterium]
HYMEEAEKADRVLVMNYGKFIADGTPKEIFKNVSLLKSVGLDVPQTTELLYELNNNGIKVPTDVLSIEETANAIANYLEEK